MRAVVRGSVKLPPSTVRRRPPLKKVSRPCPCPRPRPRGRDRHLPLRPILFGLLAVLLGGLLVLSRCRYRQPVEPSRAQTIAGIPVTEEFIPEGNAGRPGIKREIKWVVIHETANHSEGADAQRHSEYIQKKSVESTLSWHYTVDDHQIYHHLPDDEVGWHAGDKLTAGGGNQCGIGVEICVNDDGDYAQAVDNAAKLTAYLLDYYGLGIENIKQHHDFMEKNCPQIMRDTGGWEAFLQKVEGYRAG